MKVLFITPPSAFLLDERVFMSLGILKVAAACEAMSDDVTHLDLNGVQNPVDATVAYLRDHPTDAVALTATTPQMPAAYRIAQAVRGMRSGMQVILGGPHATLTYAAAKHEKKRGETERACHAMQHLLVLFDAVVCGDGELAIYHALRDGGLIDADDPKGPWFLGTEAIREPYWPARHLVDVSSYHYKIDGEPALSLISQLGCPFGCGFCAGRNTAFLRRVRVRPTENVLMEVFDLHQRYNIKGFMFLDDELNVNREMLPLMHGLKELADRLGIQWKLRGFIKAELFTHEQAVAMWEAGFREILIGFESGDPRILENIQKNATREDNTRAISTAHAQGIRVKALMSIGHPGESEASIMATRDWLLAVRPDDFDVTVIQPYPGSPYYDRAQPILKGFSGGYMYVVANGDRLYMEDVDFLQDVQFYKGMRGSYRSFVWTNRLTPERICELRDAVENEVREKLHIPFYSGTNSIRFDASMGQLPGQILRTSSVRP